MTGTSQRSKPGHLVSKRLPSETNAYRRRFVALKNLVYSPVAPKIEQGSLPSLARSQSHGVHGLPDAVVFRVAAAGSRGAWRLAAPESRQRGGKMAVNKDSSRDITHCLSALQHAPSPRPDGRRGFKHSAAPLLSQPETDLQCRLRRFVQPVRRGPPRVPRLPLQSTAGV